MSDPKSFMAEEFGMGAGPSARANRDFADEEPTREIPVETMAEVVAEEHWRESRRKTAKSKSTERGLATDLAMGLHSLELVRRGLDDLRSLMGPLQWERVIGPIVGNLDHGVRAVDGVRGRL